MACLRLNVDDMDDGMFQIGQMREAEADWTVEEVLYSSHYKVYDLLHTLIEDRLRLGEKQSASSEECAIPLRSSMTVAGAERYTA